MALVRHRGGGRARTWLVLAVGAVAIIGASAASVVADEATTAASADRLSSCPRGDVSVLVSSRPGAETKLVPTGAHRLLLCRYDGPVGAGTSSLGHRFLLVARMLIADHVHVRSLAAQFNRLSPNPNSYGCHDSDAAILAFFGYPSGPVNPVRVDLSGCATTTNGHAIRTAGLGWTALLNELEALVHARPPRSGVRQREEAATISGAIRLCGGPAPGRCFDSTIGVCVQGKGCSRTDRVVVIDSAGEVVAEEKLAPAHSRFRLRVPTGNLAVELLADGRRVHDRLVQTHGVTTRQGGEARVVFRFDVP